MVTIPARLARSVQVSTSPQEARTRVLKLYRDWYRGVRFFLCTLPVLADAPCDAAVALYRTDSTRQIKAPEICTLYALNVSPAYVRHCIRQHFEQNRYVSDTRVIDVLIQKGRIEYQETMNCWKQLDHIMGILLQPKGRPPRTFLQKFYEGTYFSIHFDTQTLMRDRGVFTGRDEDAVLPAATGIVHPKAV